MTSGELQAFQVIAYSVAPGKSPGFDPHVLSGIEACGWTPPDGPQILSIAG
jgi:hypothetical protein